MVLALSALIVLVGLMSVASPSLALSQRGHSFQFSFGEGGSGDAQFASPSGVAVNEATGEMYVSDAANNRVDQYAPELGAHGAIIGYTFKRAWGWGVADGEKRYETCETACREGLKGRKFFNSPGEIAVDESTSPADPSRGNVYVVANHVDEKGRVYEFGPEGEPVSTTEQHGPEGAPAGQSLPAGQPPMALGTVEEEVEGKTGKWKRNEEVTEEAIGEELEVIEGVAVDQSGLVWLYGEDDELRAFTPQGALTEDEPELEALELGLGFGEAPGRGGLAVQTLPLGTKGATTQDRLYVRYEAHGERTEGKQPKGGYCTAHECRTAEIDAFAISQDKAEHIGAEEEGEVLSGALGGKASSAVAVDPLDGDAFLADSSGIAALDAEGSFVQSFGGPEGPFAGLGNAVALAVDHAAGAEVGEVFAVDDATDQIDAFAPAPPGPPSVDGASTREVTSESARLDAQVDPGGAPTTYTVQYTTTACTESLAACASSFTCTAGSAVCGELPSPPASVGEGFGDQSVSVGLSGLTPSTTYHYWFVASNEHGRAVSAEQGAFSTQPAECDCIADGRLWELVSPPAKDGALVEPLTAFGGVIQAAADTSALAYITATPVGEAQGSRSFEPTQMLASRSAAGWSSQDLMTANEHGIGLAAGEGSEYRFFSGDLSLSIAQPYPGLSRMAEPPLAPPLSENERRLAQERLNYQENTLYLRADEPLAPVQTPGATSLGATQGFEAEQDYYREGLANGEAMAGAGFLALVNGANVLEGTQFGPVAGKPSLLFLDGTPDLSDVVFASQVALTSESTATPAPQNLYEWSGGRLRLVNVLPGGEVAGEAELGAGNDDLRNAISNDGSRIFWSTEGHLYMRDTASAPERTIKLDKVLPPLVEPSGNGHAVFQAASGDGSRVFFTDEQRLTEDSGAGETKPDLYECTITENPTTHAPEGCVLTDLTPAHETPEHRLESADVRGQVLGVSEDGSYAYFVADGVQSETPNARGEVAVPGLCATRQRATCNLYVDHYDSQSGHEGWQAPRFIAPLSSEDEPDWTGLEREPRVTFGFTSRVSSSGKYLAFMSDRPLTGYDNRASAPGAHDTRAEEVFLYDAGAGTGAGDLLCPSCDSSGARPVGVLDPSAQNASGPEGDGLLVDRPKTWEGRWLAGSLPGYTRLASHGERPYTLYQSRYLSSSGRLFFDSPEPLVPQDTNGKEDVYEYEPDGVPRGKQQCQSSTATFAASLEGCLGLISSGTSDRESAFLDASESGGEGDGGETLAEGGADVYFVTTAPLSTLDTDTEFDVYDAHECTTGSPCIPTPEQRLPTACESSSACRPYAPPPPSGSGVPASAGPGANGNLNSKYGVLSNKTVKPSPLTRAQKLAKALASCRAQHSHSKRRRLACERAARTRYSSVAGKLASALEACRRSHAGESRLACERQARSRYAREQDNTQGGRSASLRHARKEGSR